MSFEPIQFGRYLLTERIAVGGMAEIFIAKIFGAMGFEKQLVIKRILPQFAQDDEFLRMFVTEAKLVCHLEHPNIVQVFELGELDGQFFIAMEYVNGIDGRQMWRTLAKRKQRLPGVLALFVISELLKGLDYAHRAVGPDKQVLGVVHRDVSPSNVMVSFRGNVKIGDFGIALVEQETKTQAGVLKGKYGYMSPEQVAGLTVDHRSDIFASGIVLAELLLGRRLFLGRSDFETLDKVLNVRLDVIEKHAHALPADAVRIVRRALQREPDDRYPSARDFHDDIMDFLFSQQHRVTSETLATFIAQHVAAFIGPRSSEDSSSGKKERSPATPIVPDEIVPRELRERRRTSEPLAGPSKQQTQSVDGAAILSLVDEGMSADDGGWDTPTGTGELDLSAGAAPSPGPGVPQPPAPGFDLGAGEELDLSGGVEEDPPPSVDSNAGVSSGLAAREVMFTAQLTPVVTGELDPGRPPDFAGKLSNRTVIKVLFRFSLVGETGLLTLTGPETEDDRLAELIAWVRDLRRQTGSINKDGSRTCEIHLQEGQPHLVAADRTEEALLAFLIRTDELEQHKVERALKSHPQRNTIAAVLHEGLIAPLQVSRYVTAYVLDNVTDTFGWTDGDFAFYRDRDCSKEAFPTGLGALEFVCKGAESLPEPTLSRYFNLLEGQRLSVNSTAPLHIDAFPQQEILLGVYEALQDRPGSLDDLLAACESLGDALEVKRALYTLIECEMAAVG